jgi:UDP-N-acetylglucosamine acyltransferase
MTIHPTACIADGAILAPDVTVGPYAVVGPHVRCGAGVVLHAHSVVEGHTTLGNGVQLYPFASIGLPPQDLKFGGEQSFVEVGAGTIIREHATVHAGTTGGGLYTRVGENCLLMVGVHIAHDCTVSNHVILANNATLAGHVVVGEYAVIGGLAAVHQFVRLGAHSMVGGLSGVEQDVPPFATVLGNRADIASLNAVGLKRRGFSRPELHALRQAFRALFAGDAPMAAVLATLPRSGAVAELAEFLNAPSKRGICRPRAGVFAAGEDEAA